VSGKASWSMAMSGRRLPQYVFFGHKTDLYFKFPTTYGSDRVQIF
jgi:hypothetical protein